LDGASDGGQCLELDAQLPLGGGAANNWPITEKRNCTQRSCSEGMFDPFVSTP